MRPFQAQVNDAMYKIGYWAGMADATHTCPHQWPPDKNCSACRSRVKGFAYSHHFAVSYHLFGLDAIVPHYKLAIERKERQRQANINKGAGI